MTRAVVGVIGHVDHGKTALVRALTGTDTDRLAEEKARGISIALGFAHLGDGDASVDLIDMPGHERFVRTMVAGATGIDAVLLVVAANEGVKPQTVEHVEIAGLLGIGRGVVAVTKCDLVGEEKAREVGEEAAQLLERNGILPGTGSGTARPEGAGGGGAPRLGAAPGGAPPPPSPLCGDGPPPRFGEDTRPSRLECVLTSAPAGQGIAEIRAVLIALATDRPPRPTHGIPFLPIDRAFAIAGHGAVVTGTLRGAAISPGDSLELYPGPRLVRVRGVQVHGQPEPRARPGQRVAINLRDISSGEIRRGMALAQSGALASSKWLTLAVRALPGAPALRNGAAVRALVGTAETDARLRLLDADTLEPGQSGLGQLRLAEPVAAIAGEHAILRLPAPVGTVAGGRILEPEARRVRRRDAAVLARLADLRDLPPPQRIAAEIARAGAAGVPLEDLARVTALSAARLREMLATLPVLVTRSGFAVSRSALDALSARIAPLVALAENDMGFGKLLAALPGASRAVLDEALAPLLAAGAIVRRGSRLALPDPQADAARARGEAELAAHIAEVVRAAGLAPPRPAEIAADSASRRAVDRLLKDGTLVRAVDRAKGKAVLFHADAIADAMRRLAPLLERGPGLLVSEIGAALGITRKHTMPLLDHLDGVRFTRREGDRRTAGAAL